MSKTATCESCAEPLPRHDAVARGDGRVVHYWHRDCYTLARALPERELVDA